MRGPGSALDLSPLCLISCSATAEGIRSAIVARKQAGLKSCQDPVEFLNVIPRPPSRNDAPNINNELVTIAR